MIVRNAFRLLVLASVLVYNLPMGGANLANAKMGPGPLAMGSSKVLAAPISPTDETKVPHYFGPYPNWANSPFTVPDVSVAITGDGTGATAVASVGANGAVTGIAVTNPGSGYTAATVSIAGGGTGATADALVSIGGVVTSITVDAGGSLYSSPVVTVAAGTIATATATAYGSVAALTLVDAGSSYAFPTVDFDMPDDPNGIQARAHATFDLVTGVITGLVIDNPGSGYSSAPKVIIRDGTIFAPLNRRFAAAAAMRSQAIQAQEDGPLSSTRINSIGPVSVTNATATATLSITSITVDTFGAGYAAVPSVAIGDATGAGSGATATASTDIGAVTAITLTAAGSGYITTGGIKKFQDGLPVLCIPGIGQTFADCTNNNLGQHIPVGVADTTTFADADYYVIALVQHREQMNSSLPVAGTLLREYVQLETSANITWSKHVLLTTDLLDGTSVPTLMPDGLTQAVAVDDPHFLGPVIVATKDRPVRIVFYNLLPTGVAGDLFLPTDSSVMGSGTGPTAMMEPVNAGTVTDEVRNPLCSEPTLDPMSCFKQDRATLHLHGGTTPWISDGTPHQWITPANEDTPWPQGVSVEEVPDMVSASTPAGVPNCSVATDGCMTFYYTNQQSARLMFYHDHSWGITRLNVYAGEAAGYLITDDTEKKLVADGTIPADQIPLIIQDRTFIPDAAQLAAQDPTWDSARWGDYGNLWYHHVYMPAQNPGDPGGMSGYGRWMYGPWFWPPAGLAKYGPIANPYYNMDPATNFTTPLAVPCNLDDPATWQYQTDPFCEPPLIPGTPNVSVGMEQFNDTPIVNGTAYPTTTVQPKTYRLRILNAANDRFWNLQWYVADPTTGTESEVALNPIELAAAQIDPNMFPTPDTTLSPAGPDWIQIGTEGGFLPAPVVIPNLPITWIVDPTRFDVGLVDQHSLLLAPGERADVIVDFSKYAGKTLILYNDAPAAFPARVSTYDYYTGAPDLSPNGAPGVLPGYGPNTRTIMQVKVAATTPAPAFNLTALRNAFSHKADGSGVFESSQHPIIVGQAAYNSAYGTDFAAGGWCNSPTNPSPRCDGLARIADQGGDLFGFNTLKTPNAVLSIPIEPKAIHDEMNAASFDEFGRMTANLGLEKVPASPAGQNVTLFPYINPATELIDATNLPRADIKVTAIATQDGTQIWKITHNGVDTHPIHFHLYDVQVLNRVTWDNIVKPTEANELGWKDTVRISPLEDTIVALRPIIPVMPFELPNSIRNLNPMMPTGSTAAFNNLDAAGNPTAAIVNQLINFGWEYVYHCHILSHEEMDMMRPVSVAMPPNAPDGLVGVPSGAGNNAIMTLTWNDNSIAETGYLVQRMDRPGVWTDLATVASPLNVINTHGIRSYVDTTVRQNGGYQYRVVALNAVGYGGQFMALTVRSQPSNLVTVGALPTAAPSALTAVLQAGPLSLPQPGPQVRLAWTNNATNASFVVANRCAGAGCAYAQIAAVASNATSYVDVTAVPNTTNFYTVTAANGIGYSAPSNTASAALPALPATRTLVSAVVVLPVGPGNNRTVMLTWLLDLTAPAATSFTIQRARTPPTNPATLWTTAATVSAPLAITGNDTGARPGTNYYYRVVANYTSGGVRISNPSNVLGPIIVP